MRMDPETKYRVASCLVVLCLVACVLGFAAICIAIPRMGGVDLDYMGVIVGILSLLVTVLMAWNIYTVIDSSGKIKRIEEFVGKESKRIKEENDLMREEVNSIKLLWTKSMQNLHSRPFLNLQGKWIVAILRNMR